MRQRKRKRRSGRFYYGVVVHIEIVFIHCGCVIGEAKHLNFDAPPIKTAVQRLLARGFQCVAPAVPRLRIVLAQGKRVYRLQPRSTRLLQDSANLVP